MRRELGFCRVRLSPALHGPLLRRSKRSILTEGLGGKKGISEVYIGIIYGLCKNKAYATGIRITEG